MDIISSIESCAIELQKDNKKTDAELLRQNVSLSLTKSINKKLDDNLTRPQRIALKELKTNPSIAVYPFDKGQGFAILSKDEALKKLEEQLSKARVVDHDPTETLTRKFQKTLCKLRKDKKFDNKTYFKVYPSDSRQPRFYGMLKAHKPSKNFPMRPVVSTIGTPAYGTSKYLVSIIQPTLNKSLHRVINSKSFVLEAKGWDISPDEIQVSYDVVNLYPSIPIDQAINVIIDLLSRDIDDLKSRTKLSLTDIHQLVELCLSLNYFLFEHQIHVIDNSGPIGLALMVVIAEAFLQFIELSAINKALTLKIAPTIYRRFVDDSHARFPNERESIEFLDLLNKENEAIQFTIETEDDNKTLNFLDVKITNTTTGKYKFNVHRKDAITNVQMKPNSFVNPKLLESVFKGFISRAKSICSESTLNDEIEFLIKIFTENGHCPEKLRKLTKEPASTNENTVQEKFVKLPWIPTVGPKLRHALKKVGYKAVFTSGRRLKDILCNNKCQLTPHSDPGVYQLDCSCGATYIGETKKKVLSRCIEHQQDSMNGKWASSGATEHTKTCHGCIDWLHPKTIAIMPHYHQRKIRESLEINRLEVLRESEPNTIMNRDSGDYVNTNSWKPFLRKLHQHRLTSNK